MKVKSFVCLLASIGLQTLAFSAAAEGHSAEYFDTGRAPAALDCTKTGNFAEKFPAKTVTVDGNSFRINVDTPLKVMVNKTNQTISACVNGELVLEDFVSTGGGYKVPNAAKEGEAPPPPRCGNTPTTYSKDEQFGGGYWMYVKGVEEKTMWSRGRTTSLYATDDGKLIEMEKAIALNYPHRKQDGKGQGYLLHRAPRGKENLLSLAVSGGCVRLGDETSKALYNLLLEHGEMSVMVLGSNPSDDERAGYPAPYNHSCMTDDQGVAHKLTLDGSGGFTVEQPVAPPAEPQPRYSDVEPVAPAERDSFGELFDGPRRPREDVGGQRPQKRRGIWNPMKSLLELWD